MGVGETNRAAVIVGQGGMWVARGVGLARRWWAVKRGRGARRASRRPVIAPRGSSGFARGCPDCNRVIGESRSLGDRSFVLGR